MVAHLVPRLWCMIKMEGNRILLRPSRERAVMKLIIKQHQKNIKRTLKEH